MPTIHFATDAAAAAFSHITAAVSVKVVPAVGSRPHVFIYLADLDAARGDEDDITTFCTGFRDTAEMLAWLSAIDHTQHKAWSGIAYISGAYDVDDAGETYCFDATEVHAGTTWAIFKSDHADNMIADEAERGEWRREIAREEGMLNGISSYNDWMQ